MMEGREILAAFDALTAERVPMSLATIVAIKGSSYRRLGARMLIAADGRRFGMVSGGCLEADVARRGRSVIDSGAPVLCRYETGADEEPIAPLDNEPIDRDPGFSLGCGGVLEILIQPLTAVASSVIPNIRAALDDRHASRAVTIYRVGGNLPFAQGSVSTLTSLQLADHADGFDRVFIADGWIDVLIETFAPPIHLTILGDGPDVLPLLELARFNGWRTTVAGYRVAAVPCNRHVQLRDHEEGTLMFDPQAAVVVMTHDVRRDARLLRRVAEAPPAYVGVLGPMHRTRRLLDLAGITAHDFDECLFAPIGLDLGGEGPRRVALSIVAEIAAVLAGHNAGHLREKDTGIHDGAAARLTGVYS